VEVVVEVVEVVMEGDEIPANKKPATFPEDCF